MKMSVQLVLFHENLKICMIKHKHSGSNLQAIMGSCMSSPKVANFDVVYVNPLSVCRVYSKEVDELLEQMTEELVVELKAKMPSVPKNKIVAR
jgi:hypothetical protein